MHKDHGRGTPAVKVGNVLMGAHHPVRIQSMTDTPTADVDLTLKQIRDLVAAGCELVRITINDEKAAAAAAEIIKTLRAEGCLTPIIGDFHFNGHILLSRFPETAKLLDKYRINPGNIGRGRQHDENFQAFIRIAVDNDKPVRIGVNSGSLNQEVLTGLMNRNAKRARPLDSRKVICQAMVASALTSGRYAMKLGLPKNKIVISVKMSDVQDTIAAYELLAQESDFALHLGLTEAGSDIEGITASCAALAVLLRQGIGDTIRVSLTPSPGTDRTREVEVCRALLQSLGLRYFSPHIISCPGCGRTQNQLFQYLTLEIKAYVRRHLADWKQAYPGIEHLKIAVMGCVVNGPGESKGADIGISLPGGADKAQAVVYADGRKIAALKQARIKEEFLKILDNYIHKRFSNKTQRG